MARNRILPLFIAIAIGSLLAWYAYQRASDPAPRQQRALEETVVLQARQVLRDYVALGRELELVDPLAPDRKVGKVYIYPVEDGWEVSGHYRRADDRRWRPWLMMLDETRTLVSLRVKDDTPALQARSATDPKFSATP